MTLEEFIADKKIRLAAFERYWQANHKKFPKDWPLEFEEGNEGVWDEQYQAFQLEHAEKL